MSEAEPEMSPLGSDADEDETLRYAIALSLKEQQPGPIKSSTTTDVAAEELQLTNASDLRSMDRRKMEAERLRRLAKRARLAAEDDDEVVELPPPKRISLASTTVGVKGKGEGEGNFPFVNATVRRTYARGFPRHQDQITIEEILQKDQLQLAVLSSFQWDEDWLLTKLNVSRTKILLVAAAEESQKDVMRANVPSNIKFCFPTMNGPGAMHSKLQLLRFPHHIRVVVPTGNLVPYDWGETGVMENMVFLIDLPRLNGDKKHAATMFYTGLCHFLRSMGLEDKMVSSLSNYDFSRTSNLAFVYSIPGGHTGDSLFKIGYCGLGTSVAALGLATDEPVDVDLVCASLGSVNSDLTTAIYNACQGDDGMKEYKTRSTRRKTEGTEPSNLLRERFSIYFPTDTTVLRSRGGRGAGGTICVQSKWWRSATFPRVLVRDCVNNREGLLMHSKLIFVRNSHQGRGQGVKARSPGWAYVGSANLSESAWGRVVKDRGSGQPKMSCRNWECGVVIPLPESSADRGRQLVPLFQGIVPVPMQVPGPGYGPTDEPWFYLGA